jgi:metal-sulfur cluster biosynthetic enzyme
LPEKEPEIAMATAVLDRATVVQALRWILDPEIGLDLVSLGLIYGIDVHGGDLHIQMTMTARGCPLHAVIADAVRDVLRWLDGVEHVTVELVWEPPWHPAMIDAMVAEQSCGIRR